MLQKYEELKRDLILVERYMLREFGFIMHVDHPHKFVLNYLTILDVSKELRLKADRAGADAETLKEEAEKLKLDADRLKQEAWRITNDRYSYVLIEVLLYICSYCRVRGPSTELL